MIKYDSRLTGLRSAMLGSVVDGIIGSEEETWIQYGVMWHRDDEYNAGMMVEEDIKEIADCFEYRGRWYGINANIAIRNGIDRIKGISFITFNPPEEFEIELMRADFVQRLIKRLQRYSKGHRLAVRDDGENVWFRWE